MTGLALVNGEPHHLQRRRTGSGDQSRWPPRGAPMGIRDEIFQAGRPVRVGSTPRRPIAACAIGTILRILRKFFPTTGQRVRPIFPQNCKVCITFFCKTQHCIKIGIACAGVCTTCPTSLVVCNHQRIPRPAIARSTRQYHGPMGDPTPSILGGRLARDRRNPPTQGLAYESFVLERPQLGHPQ